MVHRTMLRATTPAAWSEAQLIPCCPLSLRFPTLEHCWCGGEALLPEEQHKWRQETGIQLTQVYGQSETVGGGSPGPVRMCPTLSPECVQRPPPVCTASLVAVGSSRCPGSLAPSSVCRQTVHTQLINLQDTSGPKATGQKLNKGSRPSC